MTGGESTGVHPSGTMLDIRNQAAIEIGAELRGLSLLLKSLTAPANPYDPIDPYYRKPDIANVT